MGDFNLLDAEDIPSDVRLQVYRGEVKNNLATFQKLMQALWKVVVILFILLILNIVIAYTAGGNARDTTREVLSSRENGFKSRAMLCLTVALDNDRTFDIPAQCLTPEVVKYYPKVECGLFGNSPTCGSASDVG